MPPRSRGSACARRRRPRHSRSSRQPHLEEQLWALARPRAAGQPAGALAVPRRSLSRCQPLREEAALLAAEGAAAMLAAPAYGLLSTWILWKNLEHPGVAGFSGLREHCQEGEKGKASARLRHRGGRRTGGRACGRRGSLCECVQPPGPQVAGGVPLAAAVLLWAPGDLGKLRDSGAAGGTLRYGSRAATGCGGRQAIPTHRHRGPPASLAHCWC